MLRNKKLAILAALLMIAPMVLAACGPTPEPQVIEKVVTEVVEKVVTQVVEVAGTPEVVEKVVTEVVEVPKEVQVEVTATPAPVTRKGGWLDMVVYVEEPQANAAVTRLDVGEMDVYAYAVSDPELFKTVQANSNLAYTMSYGSYNELTFNVADLAPIDKLNPFYNQKIREAMNWLVDRSYIVQEIFGGLARARYTALSTVSPDYAKVAPAAAALEAKYAYDLEKARTIITQEMEGMGATMADGKWTYNGEPITLIFLIRVEDERRAIGDYVSNQLEDVGFTVDRQYKTSAEAAALWVRSDPNEGLWSVYTGGWVSNFVNRDLAGNFEFFYTPRGYPIPLWQIYNPSEALNTCADRLNRNDFQTIDERTQLMSDCLGLAMEDSVRIFLNDRSSFTPRRANTEVTGDLAAGVYGSRMNSFTMRFKDQVGGAMTVGMPSILTEPWNPVAGTNWVYDAAVQRMTADWGFMTDPFTGLRYPQRVDNVVVEVKTGLPASSQLDWVSTEFVDEIVVPDDAWVDWDATNQVFITAAEKFTQTQTAQTMQTLTYRDDLLSTTWHDGSPFDLADIVMYMIMYFDTGKPDSAIFDSSQEEVLNAFLTQFKGVRIVSEDPVVIETYSDNYYLESELLDQNYPTSWYPNYGYGISPWQEIALGYVAESKGELAFSAAKADEMEVEWMNLIGGPSIDILSADLVSATAEAFIPYAPTLSNYITADEAAARWTNYSEWFRKRGHFWVGNGPYYLEGAFPVEGTVIIRQNANFVDNADRWAGFTTPKIPIVEIDGPGQVSIGSEAAYDVFVTFGGEPYPAADIDTVTYLMFDATGALVGEGMGELVTDGQYSVTLTADQTGALQSGANRLEVVVVSKLVAIPASASYEFVTQ